MRGYQQRGGEAFGTRPLQSTAVWRNEHLLAVMHWVAARWRQLGTCGSDMCLALCSRCCGSSALYAGIQTAWRHLSSQRREGCVVHKHFAHSVNSERAWRLLFIAFLHSETSGLELEGPVRHETSERRITSFFLQHENFVKLSEYRRRSRQE